MPLTYFLEVLRGVMLKGVGLDLLWPQVWPLAGFAVLRSPRARCDFANGVSSMTDQLRLSSASLIAAGEPDVPHPSRSRHGVIRARPFLAEVLGLLPVRPLRLV